MFPGSLIFLKNIKEYNHLSYIFFRIVPLFNCTLFPANVKVLETFLEAILWKPFQLFRRILNYVSSITKPPSLQCWFQSRERVKTSCSRVGRVWGMLECCHIFLCQDILDRSRPVCWSIVIKEKPAVGFPFLGAFTSDRVPKATMDVNVHFFSHSSNSCKLNQRIPGAFSRY